MRITTRQKRGWATCAASAILALVVTTAADAGPCDPPPVGNPIACENANAGNPPSEWDIIDHNPDPMAEGGPTPDDNLVGFATRMSVNKGQSIGFKIQTDATSFRIDVYRIGYYGGNGARLIATLGTFSGPTNQPSPSDVAPIDPTTHCAFDDTTGLVDCGNWDTTTTWLVPSNAVSGVYIAKLTRLSPNDGRSNHIIFVVRDDSSASPLLVQTSDPTWQAYNYWGGFSLYRGKWIPSAPCDPPQTVVNSAPTSIGVKGRAYKVSYNRPFAMKRSPLTNCSGEGENGYFRDGTPPATGGAHGFFSAEYSMVRFLERNGFDVSYISGVDTAQSGALLLNHPTFIVSGHDEYWSGDQRAAVEKARAAGVNLAFFAGNDIYIKTRWESSIAGTPTSYRTLVTYKEDATYQLDPTDVWTGEWRANPAAPLDGGRPENALSGTIGFVVDERAMTAPDARFRDHRFWRNITWTGNPPTPLGFSLVDDVGNNIIGYEWNVAPDDASTPAGLMKLSETICYVPPSPTTIHDCNTQKIHNMTLYRDRSGAMVFSAGTIQWAFGLEYAAPFLDGTHKRKQQSAAPDQRMQQATMNLLIDLEGIPATPMGTLVVSSPSSDTTAPLTTFTPPQTEAAFGAAVSLSGSASDVGGVVGAVELSFDGGNSWRRAVLNMGASTTWTYSWTANVTGQITIKARAVDDSGNIGAPATQPIVVTQRQCPCSIWENTLPTGEQKVASTTPPPTPPAGDIELGVRFFADAPGAVTGIRYYRDSLTGQGTHTGRLWDALSQGQLGDALPFTGETPSGWQLASFDAPIAITPDYPYVASYHSQNGYIATPGYFMPSGVDNTPLHAPRSGAVGTGTFKFGASAFPDEANLAANYNYWVDLSFSYTTCMMPVLEFGIKARWTFDEGTGATDADDYSANDHVANHGATTRVPGRIGTAREFDGVDDSMIVANATTGVNIQSGGITIGAWLRPSRGTNYVFGHAGFNGSHGLYSFITTDGYPGYGFHGGNLHQEYRCNTALPLGVFSHVVFAYTMGSGSTMACYINGQPVSGSWIFGDGNSLPTAPSNYDFEIGHWYGTPPNGTARYWFQGAIDEPFVYARELKPTEVLGIYTNSGRDAAVVGLPDAAVGTTRGKWNFNDTTPLAVIDSSGRGNNGTIANTTIVDGAYGAARRFAGNVGSKVTVASSTDFKISGNAITIGAWVMPERDDNYVMGYASDNANWGLYSMFISGGAPHYGYFSDPSGTNPVHEEYRCNAILPNDRLTMVAFTYSMEDGSSMRCYINGQRVGGSWVVGNGNAPPKELDPFQAFEIGHWYGTTDSGNDRYSFKGVIDEPFVIKAALTAAEIKNTFLQVCR